MSTARVGLFRSDNLRLCKSSGMPEDKSCDAVPDTLAHNIPGCTNVCDRDFFAAHTQYYK